MTSAFTGNYVRLWSTYFPENPISSAPCFDGRVVEYPSTKQVKDYLAWRQVDAHINNQVTRNLMVSKIVFIRGLCCSIILVSGAL